MAAIAIGDRTYIFALFGVIVLIAAMLIGPVESYTAAVERVDALRGQRAELSREVDQLADRRQRLHNSDEVEVRARSELGLVMPGELPYVVARPDGEPEPIRPDGRPLDPEPRPSWWQRLAERFRGLLSAS